MKLSVNLTEAKKFCHRSIEKLKVNTLVKKGTSVLVGSFVWEDSTTKLVDNAATMTSLSTPSYCIESYIVAVTDAAQTDLDILSAGEIITKQFKTDHPHINKLHKRTDNAGNFSSHATPEAEKLICERVSHFLDYLALIHFYSIVWYSIIDTGL